MQVAEEDWNKLEDDFDTTTILAAVDVVAELRGYFADREDGVPLELRDDILKLHQLAMDVVHLKFRNKALGVFNWVGDIEIELTELVGDLKAVGDAVGKLANQRPKYLYD